MLTGSGGWPLNAITLPAGRLFFAGAYFPLAQWIAVLEQIVNLYNADYDKVLNAAELCLVSAIFIEYIKW